MNTVEQLLAQPFSALQQEEKLEVKRLGPDHPDINLEQASEDRGKKYVRKFTVAWYDRTPWLTASATKNSLFCFPCLLFGGDAAWTRTGVTDLKHLSPKIKKHGECKTHLTNSMKLALFGQVNIAQQLDEGYCLSVARHNQNVDRNRHILSKLIDCIRFCGAFELPLRGHDETEESLNPGVFRGLVDFAAEMDSAMRTHLDTATVFKGTSKTIQNELLDCMLDVTRQSIIEEIRRTAYLAIIADDTTDVSTHTQSSLIFRYIDGNEKIVECFFCFTVLPDSSANTISAAILKELSAIFPDQVGRHKVIAQSYDGASVMRGASGGVQKKIKDIYPHAHYVHCYAHQLNLIMQQAASKISHVRIFFTDLSGFPAFFSCSPKRTEVLDRVVHRRLPRMSGTRWNFRVRTVQTVYEHREDLLECFETILVTEGFETIATREAQGFIRTLGDRQFLFFLFLFNGLMFHVDILYNQLQKRDISSVSVQKDTTAFVDSINKVRLSVDALSSKLPKESVFSNPRMQQQTLDQVAKEVCDLIIVHAKERFKFTQHLVSATLLQSAQFGQYARCFPAEALSETAQAYPMLNKQRLQNELSILYETPEFHQANGAVGLFRLLLENKLQSTFSETLSLLRIVITTPMTTAEAERSFSTLKRIKDYLRSTMSQDRLNALAMLAMEKQLVRGIPDFNKKVIELFASLKERRAKFLYK